MLKIETAGHDKGKITLTRGDSAKLKLKLVDVNNKPYELAMGDTAVLSIKADLEEEEPALEVPLNSQDMFVFKPEDTKELDCGNYFYDIQVTLADGSVFTVVPLSKFVLGQEVSR